MEKMIDHYYYQPQSHHDSAPDESIASPKKHRRLLKLLLISFLIIVLVFAVIIGLGYWYVRAIPLVNSSGRTNVLILGVDEAADLSDTIMIASIDHADRDNPRVALVSIPRDLYLDIEGFGSAKINAAHAYGEHNNYPGGGVALTAATLERHFDLPIHYHAVLEFEGVKKVVDALGGVEIDVPRALSDPLYPNDDYSGYDPFMIEAGVQQLDGEAALKYARSRQTTSDFDRAYRQQQVALEVRNELLERESLLNLATLRMLVATFDESVTTNAGRLELIKFIDILRRYDDSMPPQYVLSTSNLLVSTQTAAGDSLVPRSGDFTEIRHFINYIFDQDVVSEFNQE